MLRTKQAQLTLWDAILPEPLRDLPEELAKVDAWLDDDRFLSPFVERFHTRMGRPTVPVETYIRLMYLKCRHQLGYESLMQEVNDSLIWRRFCRIPLCDRAPDASTLCKATQRCGKDIVRELHDVLCGRLQEQRLLRTRKLRTDTTVVESDIHHPTDATLLRDGITVITRRVRRVRRSVSHAAEGFIDRTEDTKRHILSFAKVLCRRTKESWEEVNAITRQVLDIADDVCEQARRVREKIEATGRECLEGLACRLDEATERTVQLAEQARQVVAGNRIIPNRMVSFHDSEARPIRKGKLAKPTEFGYKVRVEETESGFVTGYDVYIGNPTEDSLRVEAVQAHIRQFGQAPHAVATDRGFSSRRNERELEGMGVRYVSSPQRGKKGAKRREHEEQPWFRDLQRFRAAGEARISLLKRRYGQRRSRYRGYTGTKTWVGFGILAHNLHRAGRM